MCACSAAQSCPTCCDPVNCSPPGSSVHGISQAGTLEWVAISSSRGSSWTRDRTQVPALAGGIFITEYMESRNKKYKVFIIFDMTPKRYLLKRRTKCRSSLRGGLHFPRLTMYHDWNVIFMKLPGPAYEKINQEQFSLERFSSSGRKISKAKKWKLT